MKNEFIKKITSILIVFYFLSVVIGSVSAIASLLLLLSILYLVINYKKIDIQDRAALLWPGVMILYGIYYAIMKLYFSGNYDVSIEKQIKFIGSAVFFIYLSQIKIDKKIFELGVLLGGFIIIASVIYEVYENGITARLNLGHNPIVLGWIMVLYSVCLFVIGLVNRDKIIYFIVGLAVLILSILTGTRGLYPIYLIILPIIIYLKARAIHVSEINFKKIILFIIAVVATTIVLKDPIANRYEITASEVERINSGDLTSSFGQRIQMYNSALYISKKSLVFGSGTDLDTMNDELQSYFKESNYRLDLLKKFSHFHNEYLNALVGFGLIGLFLYLLIIAIPIIIFNGAARYIMFCLMSVYIIGSLFDSPFYSNRSASAFLTIIPVMMVYVKEFFKECLER